MTTLVLWERFPFDVDVGQSPDRFGPALGDSWRLVGEEVFRSRLRFNWAEFDSYRRREYVRQTPATAPAPPMSAPPTTR